MIRYMLDTDICSYIMREKPVQVLEHFNTFELEQFCISVVTYAEFKYGIQRSSNPEKHGDLVNSFVRHVNILPWDPLAAEQYGQIRNELEANGLRIGNMDIMIASHAISQDMILVTNNEKHYGRVQDLKIENWAK